MIQRSASLALFLQCVTTPAANVSCASAKINCQRPASPTCRARAARRAAVALQAAADQQARAVALARVAPWAQVALQAPAASRAQAERSFLLLLAPPTSRRVVRVAFHLNS